MNTPTIKIDSKSYTAKKPKAKIWREFMRFERKYGGNEQAITENYEEYLDGLFSLIALGFNLDAVTPELVEENLDVDEVMTKYLEMNAWVGSLVAGGVEKLPAKNVQKATQNPTNQ